MTFVEGATRGFGGASSITVTVTSTLAQNFTVRANNTLTPDIKGESGLITVDPDTPDSFTTLSSSGPITVGTERLLRVRLIDQYTNPVPLTTVTFTAPAAPSDAYVNGVPGTKVQNTDTDAAGIAEMLFNASTDITVSPDIIQISDGSSANTSINLVLQANNVSYYTLSPSGNRNFTAGNNLAYTLTARDQYGNGVLNSDDVTLSAFNGASVNFVEGTARNFGGDSVLTVTVTSNLAQSFIIRVVNDNNGELRGESDLITVDPAAPDHLTMLSVSDPINIRGSRTLLAALEDVYNNRISGSSVTYTIRRGNGYFGTLGNSDTLVAVDLNGVYETPYTASDALSFISDSIDVTSAGVALVPQVFTLQQSAANLSNYTFAPSGAQNFTAGGNLVYTITARDQFGNGVLNTGSINLTAVGGSGVTFVEGNPLGFGGDSTVTLTVTTDQAQSFAVRAENSGNSLIAGQSGLVTVAPAAADHFVVLSATAPITVGNERLLQVRLEDVYNNPVPSAGVTFSAPVLPSDAHLGTNPLTKDSTVTTGSGGV